MSENENETKSEESVVSGRRRLLGLGAIGAVAAVGLAACDPTGTNQGNAETGNVGNTNNLTDQQASLTIDAYNRVKDNPECQYPAKQLTTSLELQNQRKKLLMFNEPTKLGWVYLISYGAVIAEIPVIGKVSSVQSSMTADVGVYEDRGSNGGGNVNAELPGDDLSFGPSEGGPNSVFFFTVDGVYMNWTGDYLYTDAQLSLLTNQLVKYEKGSKPAN